MIKVFLDKILLLLGLLFLAPSSSGVSWAKPTNSTPLYIVTTTSQIGDLVRNIAGDSAKVEHLMGNGIDPHLYHPTRSDISKLMKADIIFYNGMNLEGKMEHLLEQLGEKKPAISLAKALFSLISGLKTAAVI